MNEDVFQKAFSAAEVANFTPTQLAEYEQSRMTYLGLKAVSDTAKEEKEIEMILKPYHRGKSVEEISDFFDIPIDKIIQIIKDHNEKS